MRLIRRIFIHCTATPPDWMAGHNNQDRLEALRLMHLRRGWSDIGYHYVIMRDGTVMKGRPVEKVGAHVRGHNRDSIGIALMGGWKANANDAFEVHFTPEQDKALRELLRDLKKRFPSIRGILGHNEVAAKACPGFRVDKWLSGPVVPDAPAVREIQRMLKAPRFDIRVN